MAGDFGLKYNNSENIIHLKINILANNKILSPKFIYPNSSIPPKCSIHLKTFYFHKNNSYLYGVN